jgi:hypothetical protein
MADRALGYRLPTEADSIVNRPQPDLEDLKASASYTNSAMAPRAPKSARV